MTVESTLGFNKKSGPVLYVEVVVLMVVRVFRLGVVKTRACRGAQALGARVMATMLTKKGECRGMRRVRRRVE